MSTEKSKLKPKTNLLAKFECSTEVHAIGIVMANGVVSLHGYDATYREKSLPGSSDQDSKLEKSPIIFFEVKAERVIKSFTDHYQKPRHRG
jgi:hypothetical protein